MSKELVKKLADLFRRAAEAALAADTDEDGGTCNFDTPAFRIKRCRKTVIEAAAREAGVLVDVTEFTWFGQRWFWLIVPMHGQAARRTRMAEAAAKVLREAQEKGEIPEFRALLYCQSD
jgi:hypothetical protein